MLVLCAGAEANVNAEGFRITSPYALASAPSQRTTAHALPLSGHPKLLIGLCTRTKAVPVSVSPRPPRFLPKPLQQYRIFSASIWRVESSA